MFSPPALSWPLLAASWAPLGVQSPDSAALHDQARSLQVRFERQRVRALPRTLGGGSRECDETIGRLCVWDDGDEQDPRPEPPEVGRDRNELLAELAVLADSIPGDHWLFGQRIRYLAEAGRLEDAESLATACGLPDRWRCDAYLGFALHLQGRVPASANAFDRALAAMPTDLRAEWTDPAPLLDGPLRDWTDDQPDSALALSRLWTLADPLYLAPGNDRWTGHLTRWTYAMSSEGARNPHGMQWADDLTEAAVRYGWSVAWEKGWPRGGEATPPVVGRDPPAAYRTFPPAALLDPSEDDAIVPWVPPRGHARSAYLAPHLDSLGVLDGQVGRFWRRGSVLIVAAAAVPEWPDAESDPPDAGPDPSVPEPDTSAPRPDPGAQRDGASVLSDPLTPIPSPSPSAAGLFLIAAQAPPATRPPERPSDRPADRLDLDLDLALDLRVAPDSTGAVRLAGEVAPTAWGVASLEVWDRKRRRAQRMRVGMGLGPVPPDVFALSDLMLLEPVGEPAADPPNMPLPGPAAKPPNTPLPEPAPPDVREPPAGPGPTTFQEMVRSLRLGAVAAGDEALGVALEVYGLGYRPEAVGFRAWVEDRDPSALRRLARRLGLGGPAEKVALQWSEAGPDRPGPFFRAFSVRLPELEPGAWEVAVEVSVAGRSPLVRRRAFTVLDSR